MDHRERDDEDEQQAQDRTDRGLSVLPALRSTNRPRPPDPSEHACVEGWTGTEDQPRPCTTCKPHLQHGRHGWYRPERSTDRRTR